CSSDLNGCRRVAGEHGGAVVGAGLRVSAVQIGCAVIGVRPHRVFGIVGQGAAVVVFVAVVRAGRVGAGRYGDAQRVVAAVVEIGDQPAVCELVPDHDGVARI